MENPLIHGYLRNDEGVKAVQDSAKAVFCALFHLAVARISSTYLLKPSQADVNCAVLKTDS
jgi:hypothetical protein